MRFRALGPMLVRGGAGWVPVPAEQQRVVLAVLMAEAGRVVSTERLADAVWSDRPPRRAVNTVQAYVMRLRRLLGEDGHRLIVTRDRGYELAAGDEDIDITVFEGLVGAGRQELEAGRAEAGVTRLAKALALWSGPVFADVPAISSLSARSARLEQVRLTAQEDHLGALLDLGRHATAVDELHRLVEDAPLRERRWVLLMRALAGSGRRAEALEAFRKARHTFRTELGLEPGSQLHELQRTILTENPPQTPAGDARPAVRPAQLPANVRWFTGREDALGRLTALLAAHGGGSAAAVVISAIDGQAGVGKTALAVHWAHRIRDRFPDGQLYVNLRGYGTGAPLRPIDALVGFLPALGVPAKQVPDRAEEAAALYRSHLAGKRVLVVLDNAASPDQVRPLLPGDPGCLVLVTSRNQLRGLVARDGAARINLDVLRPADAATLLARLLGTDPGVPGAELARLCGYLPLALRIAAANIAAHPGNTVAGYTERLRTGNRLDALQAAGDPYTAVRAAFDHSYTALPTDTRRLFRLLGLFPGPDITAEVAAALVDLPADAAGGLLDQLAVAHLIEAPVPGRYTLHDLLRHYAADRADAEDSAAERAAARARLLDHYLSTVDSAASLLYPHVRRLPVAAARAAFDDHGQALAWLDAERPNLVAAVTHAAEHGPHPVAARLADALRGYLFMGMHPVDWLAIAGAGLAAAEAGGDPLDQAAAHLSLGTLYRGRGRSELAIDHYTRAHTLATEAGWLEGSADALGNLGILRWMEGRPGRAIEHYTQALDIARRTGRLAGQVANLRRLGHAYWGLGRLRESADHLTQALELHRWMPSRSGEARTLAGLGEAYRSLGRLDDAVDALTEALALHREFGDRNRETDTVRILAATHRDAGRNTTALPLATAALALARDTGNRPNEAEALTTLATVRDRLGQFGEALDGHRQALELARQIGGHYTETEALTGLAAVCHQTGQHGLAAEHAEAALAVARRAQFRVLEADALTELAMIHRQLDPARARGFARRALAIHRDTGNRIGAARARSLLDRAVSP